eukprot:m.110899 g.110899  ORF g.110899 m.110899 type:complete len:465 (-) comp21337_c0_seq1:218-1612(-)
MSASDSFTLHIDDHYRVNRKRPEKVVSWAGWVAGIFRQIWESVESRNIFLFLMINLSFAFVELFYGIWTNSLGLITDSFHMFFDCSALVAGLIASLIARWPANERYGFGYGRAQVIGGFINGLFLIFVAVFVVVEAIERFMDPPHVDTKMLLEVSVIGLGVNILGIVAFSHAHTHGGEPCDHGHSSTVEESHGHGHGGKACDGTGHGHAGHVKQGHDTGGAHNGGHAAHASDAGHGHSHGGAPCSGHGHESQAPPEKVGHGHSHGGKACDGHGVDHDGFATVSLGVSDQAARPPSNTRSHAREIPVANLNTAKAIKGKSRSFVLDGVLLHVIADTLGSVSVIISSLLIMNYGWMTADPVCSMFTALLILVSVYPLLQGSLMVLMQRTPIKLEPFLLGAYQKISAINGVVQYKDPHFWTMSGNDWYGALTLVIRADADDQETRLAAHNILLEIGINTITIQIERF